MKCKFNASTCSLFYATNMGSWRLTDITRRSIYKQGNRFCFGSLLYISTSREIDSTSGFFHISSRICKQICNDSIIYSFDSCFIVKAWVKRLVKVPVLVVKLNKINLIIQHILEKWYNCDWYITYWGTLNTEYMIFQHGDFLELELEEEI